LVFVRKRSKKVMTYCTVCFLPSTKPDLYFDDKGVCAACIAFSQRKVVDWRKRELEFRKIIERVRATGKSKWDCIVPVSGGKDSTAQVLKVLEHGLNPLCVTSTTCDLSEIGRKNIENIKSLGVDYMEFSPNPIVRAKLNKIGLDQVGDISWPEHVGIFTIPVRAAVQFGVPLIIWGENSQNEYGGPAGASSNNILNRRWLEEFGGLLGLRVSDMTESYGIREIDLIPYSYPTDEELLAVGVTGLFLGYYFPWDGFTNYFLAQARGFNSFGKVIEGSVVDYENLDNHQTGIHDYFKFLKFGFGRATDLVSVSLRRGRITRKQGLELIKLHDGKYPWTYLDKPLDQILGKIDVTFEEFNDICDRFTNKELFLKDENGKLLRDNSNSLIKVNYENIEE
jgi:N-acetyl sugar amidotransferase